MVQSVFCFELPLRANREVLVSRHKTGSSGREERPAERTLPKHEQPDEGCEERRERVEGQLAQHSVSPPSHRGTLVHREVI